MKITSKTDIIYSSCSNVVAMDNIAWLINPDTEDAAAIFTYKELNYIIFKDKRKWGGDYELNCMEPQVISDKNLLKAINIIKKDGYQEVLSSNLVYLHQIHSVERRITKWNE